jgi:hypothetical protein
VVIHFCAAHREGPCDGSFLTQCSFGVAGRTKLLEEGFDVIVERVCGVRSGDEADVI